MRAQSLALLLPLAASACGPSDGNGAVRVDLSVPGLTDVNATSPTAGQSVHPNDFLGGTSAWYFGHST